MKCLVYHAGALGDFLAILPVLGALRQRHAAAPIVLYGKRQSGAVALDCGLIDEIRDIELQSFLPLFECSCAMPADLYQELHSFSLAVSFTGEDAVIVERCRQAGITRIYRQNPFPSRRVHIADYHLSLFDGETPAAPCASLRMPPPSPENQRRAASLTCHAARYAVLHPGSGSARKNWPLDRFLETASFLRSRNVEVFWLAGPAEEGMQLPQTERIISNETLPVTGAVLHGCALYIGNDSGISHLAAYAGCPSIILFGPSDAAVWAPRGANVHIIAHQDVCSPCHGTYSNTSSCTRTCMEFISPSKVIATCESLLHSV